MDEVISKGGGEKAISISSPQGS
jgi:hypothetical protein